MRPTDAPGASAAAVATEVVATESVAVLAETGETFPVAFDSVLLDAGLGAGLDMDFGCRVGACGACAVEIVEGLENAATPDPIEADSLRRYCLPRGTRLACRTKLRGPITFRRSS